jgi:hypothetical protein
LQGTYISNNEKGTRDCGGGKVYLEKEGLIKKIANQEVKVNGNNANAKNTKTPIKTTTANKTSNAIKTTASVVAKKPSTLLNTKESSTNIIPKPSANPIANNVGNSNPKTNTVTQLKLPAPTSNSSPVTVKKEVPAAIALSALNTSVSSNTPLAKVADPIVINTSPASKDSETSKSNKEVKSESVTGNNNPSNNNDETLPWVLLGRENKLIKRLNTTSKKISLDLYDNGTIDNDTIIIYDNNKVIANLKRLSYKAIHVDLEFTTAQHDIIIVAHNMGSIPPNTALVVLNDGNNRQEYFITTTNKVNAKFEFVYKPSD